ncbi:DNA replication/repair protein RecF [Desulfallas sp. Bu1-1]|uniref:DNA replication/repair protein RecF n=1 Tax=Desulfallas sp. Bu1-1 TaxID=2787620 RepID=UPI00189D85BD|nr:DNA replication/repair protein RecF [Desulfallas sp. Bu1-1]MBF7081369.1 DNA replication/repair protein RecF [Desulfallas sp. Bu1-1]
MILKSLDLVNFRNYHKLYWKPHYGINVITGPNAQGKTNLLEAIYLTGLGFSFRNRDRDVVRWGSDFTSLNATYQLQRSQGLNVDVALTVDVEGKKKVLINGAENKRNLLPGRFGIVLFKPDDLQIIKGPPSRRRDFIDQDLGFIDPVYHRLLQQYRRVVIQRNNLLRLGEVHQESFQVWNEQFYRYGAEVLARRFKLLKQFFPLVREMYRGIAGDGEELDMKYLSTTTLTGVKDNEQLLKDFVREGKTREKEELYKKQSVFGPHRDDIVFFLNQRDVRYYGSQGQIRSIVLALKTAQIRLFHREIKEYPVLLLDDVLMELDEQRQNYLMQLVSDKIQTFITTTTLTDKIIRLSDRVYFINKGMMKEEK